MRPENWIGQVTKGVVGPMKGFEFCSKYDEKKYFRGVTLATTKYFNSNKLNTVVSPYWGGIYFKTPSGRSKSQIILNPIHTMFLTLHTLSYGKA